jgi:hypothetical protein
MVQGRSMRTAIAEDAVAFAIILIAASAHAA